MVDGPSGGGVVGDWWPYWEVRPSHDVGIDLEISLAHDEIRIRLYDTTLAVLSPPQFDSCATRAVPEPLHSKPRSRLQLPDVTAQFRICVARYRIVRCRLRGLRYATVNLVRDVERGYSPGRCSIAAVILLGAFLLLFFFGFGYMGVMSLLQTASGKRLAALWRPLKT